MIDSVFDRPIANYEHRLNRDSEWAMNEGSRHFDEKSDVHTSLKRICKHLNNLGIPYAVAGGMALFQHGFRRFTEVVDILVSRQDLKRIHESLSGRGYLPPFAKSKNLRDTETGVRIEFLQTGDYPGDGKVKPVSFPAPQSVTESQDGIQFLNLPTIVELKLASGMTGADRMKDLADVQELIKLLTLPAEFGNQLNPYVQQKYQELWSASRSNQRRYIQLWRNKFLTIQAKSIDEMIENLQDASDTLRKMRDDGVTLDNLGGAADDYAQLVTTDPGIARKYDMHDESEFWDDGESKSDSRKD